MNRFILLLLVVVITCSSLSGLHAQEFYPSDLDTDGYEIDHYSYELLDDAGADDDPGVKDFIRDTAIYYSAIWAFRFFYVRNKDARMFDTSLSKWEDNISRKPVSDDGDSFFTNYMVHPFAGLVSFLYYRQMEHELWVAALGSAVQSTIFEYTVEGLVETPSMSDLIATPLLGVPLGYGLERISDWFYNKDGRAAKVAAHILNPMRNFVDNRKVVLFNPLTGQYEFSGTFQSVFPRSKQRSVKYGYPVQFEPALPVGYFRVFMEVADLNRDMNNGELIFYHIKAEFPSESNLYSAYVKFAQAGVNDFDVAGKDVRNGFELVNMTVGGKTVVYEMDSSVYTVGMDVILPLAYKDNVGRLKAIVDSSKRDFPLYLRKSFTFAPYVSTLHHHKWLSVNNNFGVQMVTRARGLEGDGIETRLAYNSAVGISPPYGPASAVIFGEFNGVTTVTADTFKKTDIFLGGGMRLGKRFSPGFSFSFPLKGTSDDNTKVIYTVDLTIRF